MNLGGKVDYQPFPVVIQCDKELYAQLSAYLHQTIAGKEVLRGDALVNIVDRHCPEIYQMALDQGFKFVPSRNTKSLEQRPPDLRFNVERIADRDQSL